MKDISRVYAQWRMLKNAPPGNVKAPQTWKDFRKEVPFCSFPFWDDCQFKLAVGGDGKIFAVPTAKLGTEGKLPLYLVLKDLEAQRRFREELLEWQDKRDLREEYEIQNRIISERIATYRRSNPSKPLPAGSNAFKRPTPVPSAGDPPKPPKNRIQRLSRALLPAFFKGYTEEELMNLMMLAKSKAPKAATSIPGPASTPDISAHKVGIAISPGGFEFEILESPKEEMELYMAAMKRYERSHELLDPVQQMVDIKEIEKWQHQ